MKKIFSILILCLITISQSYSQTNLQTSNKLDSVLVPVKTLKNALIVLEQRNYCREQLTIVRDSITIQTKLILNQDTIITNLKEQGRLQSENIGNYQKIIVNKDQEIEIYKEKYNKEKRYKWYGIGGGILVAILSFII